MDHAASDDDTDTESDTESTAKQNYRTPTGSNISNTTATTDKNETATNISPNATNDMTQRSVDAEPDVRPASVVLSQQQQAVHSVELVLPLKRKREQTPATGSAGASGDDNAKRARIFTELSQTYKFEGGRETSVTIFFPDEECEIGLQQRLKVIVATNLDDRPVELKITPVDSVGQELSLCSKPKRDHDTVMKVHNELFAKGRSEADITFYCKGVSSLCGGCGRKSPSRVLLRVECTFSDRTTQVGISAPFLIKANRRKQRTNPRYHMIPELASTASSTIHAQSGITQDAVVSTQRYQHQYQVPTATLASPVNPQTADGGIIPTNAIVVPPTAIYARSLPPPPHALLPPTSVKSSPSYPPPVTSPMVPTSSGMSSQKPPSPLHVAAPPFASHYGMDMAESSQNYNEELVRRNQPQPLESNSVQTLPPPDLQQSMALKWDKVRKSPTELSPPPPTLLVNVKSEPPPIVPVNSSPPKPIPGHVESEGDTWRRPLGSSNTAVHTHMSTRSGRSHNLIRHARSYDSEVPSEHVAEKAYYDRHYSRKFQSEPPQPLETHTISDEVPTKWHSHSQPTTFKNQMADSPTQSPSESNRNRTSPPLPLAVAIPSPKIGGSGVEEEEERVSGGNRALRRRKYMEDEEPILPSAQDLISTLESRGSTTGPAATPTNSSRTQASSLLSLVSRSDSNHPLPTVIPRRSPRRSPTHDCPPSPPGSEYAFVREVECRYPNYAATGATPAPPRNYNSPRYSPGYYARDHPRDHAREYSRDPYPTHSASSHDRPEGYSPVHREKYADDHWGRRDEYYVRGNWPGRYPSPPSPRMKGRSASPRGRYSSAGYAHSAHGGEHVHHEIHHLHRHHMADTPTGAYSGPPEQFMAASVSAERYPDRTLMTTSTVAYVPGRPNHHHQHHQHNHHGDMEPVHHYRQRDDFDPEYFQGKRFSEESNLNAF